MPGYHFYNPANYSQQYVTANPNDPNVPAGWVLSGGSDGAIDIDQQDFMPGGASGGYPSYPEPEPGETFQQMMQRLNGSASAGNPPF